MKDWDKQVSDDEDGGGGVPADQLEGMGGSSEDDD